MRPKDVDVELPLDLLATAGLDRTERAVASVVEPYVDSPVGPDRFGYRRLRPFRVLHVERNELESRLLSEVLLRRWVAHGGDNVPTLVEKQPRSCLADAAARAGDDDGLGCRVGH